MGQGPSREVACARAYTLVKEAMRAEWPEHEKVVHTLEMSYYDHEGCAITVSVPSPVRSANLTKADVAEKHALVGLTEYEFNRNSKLPVYVNFDYKNICWTHFRDAGFSYHDGLYICWKYNEIVGHCTNAGCSQKFQ